MDSATPTDRERIEQLEADVRRLSEALEDYEYLTMRVAAMEQKWEQKESDDRRGSFQIGLI